MLQLRRRLDLGEKALGAERRGEVGVQHLDRDVAVVPEVVREIDGRHAAGAQPHVRGGTSMQRIGKTGKDIAHLGSKIMRVIPVLASRISFGFERALRRFFRHLAKVRCGSGSKPGIILSFEFSRESGYDKSSYSSDKCQKQRSLLQWIERSSMSWMSARPVRAARSSWASSASASDRSAGPHRPTAARRTGCRTRGAAGWRRGGAGPAPSAAGPGASRPDRCRAGPGSAARRPALRRAAPARSAACPAPSRPRRSSDQHALHGRGHGPAAAQRLALRQAGLHRLDQLAPPGRGQAAQAGQVGRQPTRFAGIRHAGRVALVAQRATDAHDGRRWPRGRQPRPYSRHSRRPAATPGRECRPDSRCASRAARRRTAPATSPPSTGLAALALRGTA